MRSIATRRVLQEWTYEKDYPAYSITYKTQQASLLENYMVDVKINDRFLAISEYSIGIKIFDIQNNYQLIQTIASFNPQALVYQETNREFQYIYFIDYQEYYPTGSTTLVKKYVLLIYDISNIMKSSKVGFYEEASWTPQRLLVNTNQTLLFISYVSGGFHNQIKVLRIKEKADPVPLANLVFTSPQFTIHNITLAPSCETLYVGLQYSSGGQHRADLAIINITEFYREDFAPAAWNQHDHQRGLTIGAQQTAGANFATLQIVTRYNVLLVTTGKYYASAPTSSLFAVYNLTASSYEPTLIFQSQDARYIGVIKALSTNQQLLLVDDKLFNISAVLAASTVTLVCGGMKIDGKYFILSGPTHQLYSFSGKQLLIYEINTAPSMPLNIYQKPVMTDRPVYVSACPLLSAPPCGYRPARYSPRHLAAIGPPRASL